MKKYYTITELAKLFKRNTKSIRNALKRLKLTKIHAIKKGKSCKVISAEAKKILDKKGGPILVQAINTKIEVSVSVVAKNRKSDLSSLVKTFKRHKIHMEKRILKNGKYGSVVSKKDLEKFEKNNPKPIRI